jgi:ElaB/YqjD/DUF883 family membrane-anchored ribosome-binding protein
MNTVLNGSGRAGAAVEELLIRLRALLDVLNEEGVEATTALRERISASVDALEPRVEEWRETAAGAAGYVREVIEENPWSFVVTGAVAGIAVGCVAAVVASNFIPESGLAGRVGDYRDQAVRYGRPYVRRARKLANNYWPF